MANKRLVKMPWQSCIRDLDYRPPGRTLLTAAEGRRVSVLHARPLSRLRTGLVPPLPDVSRMRSARSRHFALEIIRARIRRGDEAFQEQARRDADRLGIELVDGVLWWGALALPMDGRGADLAGGGC